MSKKETKINFEGIEEIALEQSPNSQEQSTSNEVLTNNEISEIQEEINLEKKYGNKNLRTFLEAGASAASFGISDKIISEFGGEEAKEALRERRNRNEAAALAGEVTGIVAPTLLTGGTSALAKGASAGVKAASKAGQFVEKLTAKQLAKIASETGKKQLAKDIISKSVSKSAGSAVEGAFYGAGQLISEDALGTSDFNAENLMASIGTAAMLGGAAGGIFGASEAILPVIKNNRIVDVVSKKINTNIDKRVAAARLSKMTPNEITKLKETSWGQQVYDNIPTYFNKNLKLKITDNTESLFKKSNAELQRLGDEIGETALKIDKIAENTPYLPTKASVANKVQNNLRELEKQFLKSPDEVAKKNLKKIQKRKSSWDEWLNDTTPITATEIKQLKTDLQKAAKWNKSIDQIPLDGKMDRQVSEAVRQELMDLADNVSKNLDEDLGKKLRKLNIDYGTGMQVTNKLRRTLDKEAAAESLKFKDILLADLLTDVSGGLGTATTAVVTKKFLESDLKRKLILLTNIEKSNIKVNNKITSGVKNFFNKTKKTIPPVSTKILLSTNLNLPTETGKRKKNTSGTMEN